MAILKFTNQLWSETWMGLRARGEGEREVACVWGGKRSTEMEQAERVYFLSDYGFNYTGALHHRTPRSTTVALFESLRENGHSIVADIHTHPSDWVGLSLVDEANPIEFRIGLKALVVPHFALMEPAVQSIGMHVYQGRGDWRTLNEEEIAANLQIIN